MKLESGTEGIEIQMELKYCERCGGLWLRLRNETGVHCGSCSAHFARLPKRGEGGERKGRRRKGSNREQIHGVQIEYLEGVEQREERV